MAVRDILIWPHTMLNTSALSVSEVNDDIKALIDDLIDTCDFIGGAGLAASQIGVPLQVFVVNVGITTGTDEGYEVFINPTQMIATGEVEVAEGCLSLPGVKATVKRFEQFGVEYTSIEGNKESMASDGVLGQALQHEMDHLHGKVLVEYLPRVKRPQVRRKMKMIKRRMKQLNVSYHDVIALPEE